MSDTPYRVLVVDDEPRVREATQRVLEPLGHEVHQAADGVLGLEAVKEHHPDLVLVDLMMPRMDGMEFLASARKMQPDLTFVVITGYATLDKAVEAMKQGADDFLAKPFRPKELRLLVERVLKRVRSLQDMAIEKSRIRALINAMVEPVLVVDRQCAAALTNPALAKLMGWGEEDQLGRLAGDLVPSPEVAMRLEAILDGQEPESDPVVFSLEADDGEEAIHMQVHCAPFKDGRGRLVGAVAVFEDVTALKRLDELKSQFVSMVAHEIASPLSSVLGQMQTMLKGVAGELTDKQRHLLERGAARVDGIINLSKELLDLSRMEAGGLGETAPVELKPLLEEAMEVMSQPAHEKGQSLSLSVPEDLPAPVGATRALQEVFLNLVSNAVKYTPDGGTIEINARAADGGVEVSVKDNGLGIATEDQAQVFERFYRVRNADTRSIVGTGLGLPIVKKVVEEHGGRIDLVSQPGQGSTFTVWLPLGA